MWLTRMNKVKFKQNLFDKCVWCESEICSWQGLWKQWAFCAGFLSRSFPVLLILYCSYLFKVCSSAVKHLCFSLQNFFSSQFYTTPYKACQPSKPAPSHFKFHVFVHGFPFEYFCRDFKYMRSPVYRPVYTQLWYFSLEYK